MKVLPVLAVLIAGFALTQPLLGGTTWRLQTIQTEDGGVTAIDTPERYTLTLGEDGQASFQLDCNRGTASYALEGSSLSFGPLASTRAMCPSDSLYDRYLGALEQVVSYRLENDSLYLATLADGPILEFAPATGEK